MKQYLILTLSTVFLSFVLALFAVTLVSPNFEEETPALLSVPTASASQELQDLPKTTAASSAFTPCDSAIEISLQTEDGISTLNLHDYLVGVVSAEMPASFEAEALRAQAIAARTYTLYRRDCAPSANHPQADVCNDVNCCKAYLTPDALKERRGENYDTYRAIMEDAVTSTDGMAVFYEDAPILAAFHSSSASMTEDVKNVWGTELPYLVPVKTPETEAEVNKYFESVSMTWQEFTEAIWKETESAEPVPLCEDTLLQVEYTPSGRIQTLSLGNTSLSGTSLRSLFSLRSAAIDITVENDTVTLTTTGYGHGVGLSQYGANCLAKEGKTCIEILQWYYTGASVGSVQDYLAPTA